MGIHVLNITWLFPIGRLFCCNRGAICKKIHDLYLACRNILEVGGATSNLFQRVMSGTQKIVTNPPESTTRLFPWQFPHLIIMRFDYCSIGRMRKQFVQHCAASSCCLRDRLQRDLPSAIIFIICSTRLAVAFEYDINSIDGGGGGGNVISNFTP